jgi:coenzyme F420 biosynthesis associated uncharacterized protein
MPTAPLADWGLAERVASTVASAGATRIDATQADELRRSIHAAVVRADPLARAATGLGADLPPAQAHVVSRRTWVRANIASLAWLTDPLAEQMLRRTGASSRVVARQVLGLQLGVVLGYLSTRVLGQYEAILPADCTPGRLLLVGPNFVELERRVLPQTDVDAEEFRFGVVLHELAHRLQFEAVPWMRPHLRGLLDTYFADARFDADRLREIAWQLPELLRDPTQLLDFSRLVRLVLTPDQQRVMDRAQAMMSLLEGHGNVVMDWGAQLQEPGDGPPLDPSRVRKVLNARRARSTEKLLAGALGLSMKARQYAVGEAWILDVAERHGRDTFARVWDAPDHLPTSDELEDPDAWAARVTAA